MYVVFVRCSLTIFFLYDASCYAVCIALSDEQISCCLKGPIKRTSEHSFFVTVFFFLRFFAYFALILSAPEVFYLIQIISRMHLKIQTQCCLMFPHTIMLLLYATTSSPKLVYIYIPSYYFQVELMCMDYVIERFT